VHLSVNVPTSDDPEIGQLVDKLAKHQPADPRKDLKF
jgi:hypothetical protein